MSRPLTMINAIYDCPPDVYVRTTEAMSGGVVIEIDSVSLYLTREHADQLVTDLVTGLAALPQPEPIA